MSWICEVCGRGFARRNQLHSCSANDLEHAFSGNGKKWLPLYQKILSIGRENLPPFTEHFPSVGIMWRGSSTFAEFRYTKNKFYAFFFLDTLREESHPIKHFQMSTNRVVHQVSVNEENVDEIMIWIVESYYLTQISH